MRIQPIATANNTRFQRLKIEKPTKWDLDILDAVVNNGAIRDYTRFLAQKEGKDLSLWATTKPIHMMFARVKQSSELIVRGSKEEVLEYLEKLRCSDLLKKDTPENASNRLNAIMDSLERFNNQDGVKKRNYFLHLFGLNK